MLNLDKGQSLDLKKDRANLAKVMLGAGWDVVDSGPNLDADLSAFLLTNGRVADPKKDVVYFGNLAAEGVKHSGDNLTGEGDGDDEQIMVDLSALPSSVTSVLFVINIYEAKSRKQCLECLTEAVIRAVDDSTGEEICRFTATEKTQDDALILCEVTKEGEFKAIGEPMTGTLNDILSRYK